MDWDKGLPIELLSTVAGGRNELTAMRQVSHTWKAGFERSVSKVVLKRYWPVLRPGGTFSERFPVARWVDVSKIEQKVLVDVI